MSTVCHICMALKVMYLWYSWPAVYCLSFRSRWQHVENTNEAGRLYEKLRLSSANVSRSIRHSFTAQFINDALWQSTRHRDCIAASDVAVWNNTHVQSVTHTETILTASTNKLAHLPQSVILTFIFVHCIQNCW